MAALSKRVRELDQKAGEAVTEARKYLDQIESETDDGKRSELEAKHDEVMERHDRLVEQRDAQVRREENLDAAERRDRDTRKGAADARSQLDELETRDDPALLSKVDAIRTELDAVIKAVDERGDGRRPSERDGGFTREEKVWALGRALVRDGIRHWNGALGSMGEVSGLNLSRMAMPTISARDELILADMKARAGDAQSGGLSGGDAGDQGLGGWLRPVDVMAVLEMEVSTAGPMVDPTCVTVFETMTGNPLRIPRTDQTSPGGKYIASATGGQTTPKVTPEQIRLSTRQLGAAIATSESVLVPVDLLQDAVMAFPMIIDMVFMERLYHTASSSLTQTQTTRNGANGPNNIMGQVDAHATGNDRPQVANAASFDVFADAMHSIDPRYRAMPRFGFQLHDSYVAALRKVKDQDDQYIWRMGNVAEDVPPSIWGHRYWINQYLAPFGDISATAGTNNNHRPILVGDMSKWWTRIVAEFNLRVLPELYAEEYAVGYIGFERNDGGLINTKAIKAVEFRA